VVSERRLSSDFFFQVHLYKYVCERDVEAGWSRNSRRLGV